MVSVLFVDDMEEELQALRFQLAEQYCIVPCQDARRAASMARQIQPAAVILDLDMPGYDGFRVLRDLSQLRRAPPVMMLSAYADPHFVVRALRLGAEDYLSKPYTAAMVRARLDHLLSGAPQREGGLFSGLRRQSRRSPEAKMDAVAALVGSSPVMEQVRSDILLAARSPLPVLIVGETGTGKDLAAVAIHGHSERNVGPFVARNLGALPDTIAESELFGCEAGAFTDARSRPGCFELADGGTLFLDELADATKSIQAALLRAVETGFVQRLGSIHDRAVDVRLVAAMNRNPEEEVAEGRLRGDLLFRLDGFRINMPPLSQRREDIGELAVFFAAAASCPNGGLSEGAIETLREREWPGNVRQLRMTIERAAARSRGGSIEIAQL